MDRYTELIHAYTLDTQCAHCF